MPNDTSENRASRYLFGELVAAVGTITSDSVVLNLHGGYPMYRSADLTGNIVEYAGGTDLPATGRASLEQALSIAEQFGANTIFANGSKLSELATHVERHGLPDGLLFQSAVFTSEPLSAKQTAFVRKVLGTEIGSIYGSAEGGPVGVTPLGSTDFIVDSRMFVVEILSADGQTTSSLDAGDEFGPSGEIVLTSLTRTRYPLVRYRTGDFGRICSHNNPGWFKLQLLGREKDKHFNIHGDYIEIAKVDKVMATVDGVVEWQVVLNEGQPVEFRVVFGSGEVADRAQKLHTALHRDVLGGIIDLVVKPVEYADLERGQTARKLRKVVDRR